MINESCELFLRKATSQDRDLLFNWANEPLTRKNSFNSDLIEYETHCEWFSEMMSNNNQYQYILVCKNADLVGTVDVGQIRVDVDEGIGKISYSIDEVYRGYGFGRRVLCLIKSSIKKDCPNIQKLIGEVKPNNIASIKSFMEEGYEEKHRTYEVVL